MIAQSSLDKALSWIEEKLKEDTMEVRCPPMVITDLHFFLSVQKERMINGCDLLKMTSFILTKKIKDHIENEIHKKQS